jgi:pimeloyl-ACP methyl ester carboxylesterase
MFEEHQVTTEDGYILTMHRMFLRVSYDTNRPVVFLQHGMLSNSEAWVLNLGKSVAVKLAREGYDVWLGNNRGNIYSREHSTLNPKEPADQKDYFDFSFYEMGKFDLPAMIDKVL